MQYSVIRCRHRGVYCNPGTYLTTRRWYLLTPPPIFPTSPAVATTGLFSVSKSLKVFVCLRWVSEITWYLIFSVLAYVAY